MALAISSGMLPVSADERREISGSTDHAAELAAEDDQLAVGRESELFSTCSVERRG